MNELFEIVKENPTLIIRFGTITSVAMTLTVIDTSKGPNPEDRQIGFSIPFALPDFEFRATDALRQAVSLFRNPEAFRNARNL